MVRRDIFVALSQQTGKEDWLNTAVLIRVPNNARPTWYRWAVDPTY